MLHWTEVHNEDDTDSDYKETVEGLQELWKSAAAGVHYNGVPQEPATTGLKASEMRDT